MIGGTVIVYAYKGSGSSASQYSSSVAAAVVWTSANTSIATVSPSSGYMTTVTAKSNGLVEIKGTDSNGNTRSCWVYCNTPVTSVTPKPTFVLGRNSGSHVATLAPGTDFTVSPSNANPQKWFYQSTNTDIASVTDAGTVTVKSAGSTGSATIQIKPDPDFNSIGYVNARTFKVVAWQGKCLQSSNTSSTGMKAGDTFTSSTVINIDKNKFVDVQFNNISDGVMLKDVAYKISNISNTSILSNVQPVYIGTYGYCVQIAVGSTTGTATLDITYSDSNNYFKMKYTVKVQ